MGKLLETFKAEQLSKEQESGSLIEKFNQERPQFAITAEEPELSVMERVQSDANALVQGASALPVGMADMLASAGAGVTGADVREDILYKGARAIEEGLESFFPTDPEVPEFETSVARGLGQIGAQTAAAFASGGTSMLSQFAKVPAALGIPGMGTSEALRDAAANKATPEQMQTAGAWGTVVGLTEFVPVGRLLSTMDKAAPGFKQKALNVLTTSGMEAFQEWFQSVGLNTIAKLNYDQERELLEGAGEAAGVGGTVGFIASIIATTIGAGKGRVRAPGAPVEEGDLAPETDEDLVDDEVGLEEEIPAEPVKLTRQFLAKFDDAVATWGGVENIPEDHPLFEDYSIEQIQAAAAQEAQAPNVAAIPDSMKLAVQKKVVDLGSLEAVEKLYSTDSAIDTYGRQLAQEHYGPGKDAPIEPTPEGVQTAKEMDEVTVAPEAEPVIEAEPAPAKEPKVVLTSEEDEIALLEELIPKATKAQKPLLEKRLAELKQPLPLKIDGRDIRTFGSTEAAEEDFTLNPRSFTSVEQAQKFAASKAADLEVIQVGKKFRVGKETVIDFEGMEAAQRIDFTEEDPALGYVPAAEVEIIKVTQPFKKLGDAYVAPIDDTRSVAIVKEGKQYVAYLGTAEEIQLGIAEDIGAYGSLPKARKALGEKTKVTKKQGVTFEEMKEGLEAELEKTRQEKLAKLISEQEADQEEEHAFNETQEAESLDEWDDTDQEYYAERTLDDTARDLLTIFSDQRGAIDPESDASITAARRRIAGDTKRLLALTMKVKSRLTKYPSEEHIREDGSIRNFEDDGRVVESMWRKLGKILDSQGGFIAGEESPVLAKGRALVKEFFVRYNRLLGSLKKIAKSIKGIALLSNRRPGGKYTDADQNYMWETLTHGMKQLSKSMRVDARGEVDTYIKDMEASNRIVPTQKKGDTAVPKRQRPWIKELVPPEMMEGVEDLDAQMKQGRSPSYVLGSIFSTDNNPVVDSFEALMSFTNNFANARTWKASVLDGITSSQKILEERLDPLYNEIKPLIIARNKNVRRVKNLKAKLDATKGESQRRDVWNQWMNEKKKLKKRIKRVKEELTMRYDSVIHELAKDHADIRITLQIAGELPAGVTLSENELERAGLIQDYLAQTGQDLKRVGIPIIEGREYMHRILPDLLNDPDAEGFSKNSNIPLIMKFRHQQEDGRLWYPSIHMILDSYVPLVERKVAFQPFLNRWKEFVDQLPPEAHKYMTDWIGANLTSKPLTAFDKVVNNVVMFEYMRLIGGSLSVAFKHSTKMADTLARFDPAINAKALNATNKAVLQGMAQKLGWKGRTSEYRMMRAFINQQAMVKMMDETPMMTSVGQNFKTLLGAPTMAVEFFDNGVSIFATMIAAQSNKQLKPRDASRIIWETVLAANFRGQWDQPLIFKRPGIRALAMFQMTPHKLFEYRFDILKKAVSGEVDTFGTPFGTILLRYLMMMGLAEAVARLSGNTLIDLITHTPYVSHWVDATKKDPYYHLKQPNFAPSPLLQWGVEMGDKGILTGTKAHVDYFGQFSKTYSLFEGEYPKNYYNSPVTHQFGIKKVGGGKH